jgi:hypothetical protein
MTTEIMFDPNYKRGAKLKATPNPGCIKPMTGWMPKNLTYIKAHYLNMGRNYQDNKPQFINGEPPPMHRHAYEFQEFACKQCTPCRLNYSMEWAGRIIGESKLYERNCFITLTYASEHLPENNVLCLEDLQKFKKRLRKKYSGHQEVPGKEPVNGKHAIRTYECGEMGDQFGRAHYHMCVMNFKPYDLLHTGTNKHGDKLYSSKSMEKLWGKGRVQIGELTVSSAAYVARYIVKKVNGVNKGQHYAKVNQETGELYQEPPEFATMSRRPGIGVPYFEKYKSDFLLGQMRFRGRHGQKVQRKIPIHFQNLLEITHPQVVEELKAQRKQFLKDHREAYPEEYTSERRAVKLKVFEEQTKALIRRNK